MDEKVLVTYATRFGTTREVAEVVGEVLSSQGATVTVCPAQECRELPGYHLVVIGTAIWEGAPAPEAPAFVEAHRDALVMTPVACFAVSLTLRENTKENRDRIRKRLQEMSGAVHPIDMGLFAGALDRRQLPALSRLKWWLLRRPAGDFRDFDAIRSWAGGLLPTLRGEDEDD